MKLIWKLRQSCIRKTAAGVRVIIQETYSDACLYVLLCMEFPVNHQCGGYAALRRDDWVDAQNDALMPQHINKALEKNFRLFVGNHIGLDDRTAVPRDGRVDDGIDPCCLLNEVLRETLGDPE